MKQIETRKLFISAFADPFPKFVCGTAVGIPYFAHCVINSCCPKRYIAVSLYITMSKEIDCMSTLMSPSGHSDPWAISKNKALLISDPIHITSSAKRIRPRDGRIYFAMSQLQNNPIPTDKIQPFSFSSLRTIAKTFIATTKTGKGSHDIFVLTYKSDC